MSSIVYGVVPSYLVKGIIQGVDEYFLGAFAKLRETTSSCVVSLRPSVRPHGTTRLPLDGFS